MATFEIGEMFWGKSLSYPWWPCVIVPNNKNEVNRNIKKVGVQYHVQFIGPDYDACWMTDSFLIKFEGKQHFESLIDQHINKSKSPPEKLKFDMRMSTNIHMLWMQACVDAELIFPLNKEERLSSLPQYSIETTVIVKSLSKRGISKQTTNNLFPEQTIESRDCIVEKMPAKPKQLKRSHSKVCYIEDESDADIEINVVKKPSEKKKPSKPSFQNIPYVDEVLNIIATKDVRNNPLITKRSHSSSKKIKVEEKSDYVTEVKFDKSSKKSLRKSGSKPFDNEDQVDDDNDIKDSIKRNKDKKKPSLKRSKSSDNDDESHGNINKCCESSMPGGSHLPEEIEGRCYLSYLAQESTYRLKTSNQNMDEVDLENTLREQWGALDIDTKLLYINDDVSYLSSSKSKVSGRKIKIPSRLRRTEDIAKLKKTSVNVRQSLPPPKKESTKSICSVKIENNNVHNLDTGTVPSNTISTNNVFRDTIDDFLWASLSSKDCSIQVMKIVLSNNLPEASNICVLCLKKLSPSDKLLTCKGECQLSYHLSCAITNKILRCDEASLCVNCTIKPDTCCICKNSKYMKMKPLIKCQVPNCPSQFHVNCIKYLTLNESNTDANEIVVCPTHSCLTCSREDIKHSCRNVGSFVSCIKCPVSYHDNLICLPAESQIVSSNKIICYRHFENSFTPSKSQPLLRCFICFDENPTLKCCRCPAIFHPKCVVMASYTNILRDYLCETCKLETPVFYGQVAWIEAHNQWKPVEIIHPTEESKDLLQKCDKSLVLRDLKSPAFYFKNRCDLVPFVTGLSVLKDVVKVDDAVVQLAKTMTMLYWNWRSRMRPVTSEKFTPIGQSELLKNSLDNYQLLDPTIERYECISDTLVSETAQTLIPQASSKMCSCSPATDTCTDDRCSNFCLNIECDDFNCSNNMCQNRLFANKSSSKPHVSSNSISCRGVRVNHDFMENQLLGECTGMLISQREAFKRMHSRQQFDLVSYIFIVSADLFLDCENMGNEWRHLNHSCDPNAKLICRNVKGSLKLGVVSLRPIFNEEVTIDYRNGHVLLKYGFFCKCLSTNCSKIIGPTSLFYKDTSYIFPRCCIDNAEQNILNAAAPKPTVTLYDMSPMKGKVALTSSTEHTVGADDDSLVDNSCPEKISCFKCATQGEFVTCDRGACKKQYHLLCIERSTKPIGIWLCPIHFCSECGETATLFCDTCPISSCKKHAHLHGGHQCTNRNNPLFDTRIDLEVPSSNVDSFVINRAEKIDPKTCSLSIGNEELHDCEGDGFRNGDNEIHPVTVDAIDNCAFERFIISKEDLYGNCDLVPIIDTATPLNDIDAINPSPADMVDEGSLNRAVMSNEDTGDRNRHTVVDEPTSPADPRGVCNAGTENGALEPQLTSTNASVCDEGSDNSDRRSIDRIVTSTQEPKETFNDVSVCYEDSEERGIDEEPTCAHECKGASNKSPIYNEQSIDEEPTCAYECKGASSNSALCNEQGDEQRIGEEPTCTQEPKGTPINTSVCNDGTERGTDIRNYIPIDEESISTYNLLSMKYNPYFGATGFEIVPCKVDDAEEAISSPCLLDE